MAHKIGLDNTRGKIDRANVSPGVRHEKGLDFVHTYVHTL